MKYRIMCKYPNAHHFTGFDYKAGRPVTNIIYQTMWPEECQEHVLGLVEYLNAHNPGYTFKLAEVPK